jgi:hypothetical protein
MLDALGEPAPSFAQNRVVTIVEMQANIDLENLTGVFMCG